MLRSTNLLVGVALVFGASSASALGLGFGCITDNQPEDCAIGAAQLQVELGAGPGADQVSFTFRNAGPDSASITDIYFDDGTLGALAAIVDGSGVDFEEGAKPSRLPGARHAVPGFEADFSLDSEPAVQPNGVGPGEALTVIFDLADGTTFADTLDAIADGSLRIGLHVQAFASEGSESFVSTVPEPHATWLLGAGLLGLALRGLREGRRVG